jgi:SAM-dependent methyltransferase
MTAIAITKDSLLLDRTMSEQEVSLYRRRIDEHRSWGYYQRLVIEDRAGRRLETPGTHMCVGSLAALDRHGFPRDFTGKRVLDIGCNAGFYSFVAKLRGAASVTGMDQQPHYLAQALLIREILGIDVQFQQTDGHDLDERIGSFDVVINTGVIYHLQNPMDLLGRLARITTEVMYLETEALIDPAHAECAWFIERDYCQDSSNWWIYGPTCVERMVRAAGFRDPVFQGFVWTPPHGTRTPEGFVRQGRAAFVCRK